MSSHSLFAATALALACEVAPLLAQRQPDPDPAGSALLARAESLSRAQVRADSADRRQAYDRRRGQVVTEGRLRVLLWESVSPELGRRIVVRADSTLEAFGGSLASWMDRIVAVQINTTDTGRILADAALRRRMPIQVDLVATPNSVEAAWSIVNEVARAYRATLDSSWRAWLPREFGVVWQPRLEGEWALRWLTDPNLTTGSGCLAGRVSECRLWLALDPAARPIAARYRGADIRAQLTRSNWSYGASADRDACLAADDAACVRFAETHPVVSPLPAPDIARASVVRAVWALHGPEALARAFADNRSAPGSVGERLARGAGVSEDSLVSEWRAWTLARGRTDRLAATLPQALAILFTILLVVSLATRSGRWR